MGDPKGAEKASDKAAFKSVSTTALGHDDLRAEARWERVASFPGTGRAERSVDISRRAIQWKIDWRCRSGRLQLSAGLQSRGAKPVADASCPDVGSKTLVDHGRATVRVNASDRWQVNVRQQVDTPLEEPPLAGMSAATLLSRGRFHRIQKRGEGTVSLYRLPSGRLALRYEHFYTAPSPGLELWLSRAKDPRSTLDSRRAPHVNAGAMRSTYGNYNQLLPRGVAADRIKSVIVWCPTVLIAFGAAPLG